MWPARRQVLEDFPLARMAESDCLAESGEGFPIANIQNVLVVAGNAGGGRHGRGAAAPPPPHPTQPVGAPPEEGALRPPSPRRSPWLRWEAAGAPRAWPRLPPP